MLHQQPGDCSVTDSFFRAADERCQLAGCADVTVSVPHEVREETNDVGEKRVRGLSAIRKQLPYIAVAALQLQFAVLDIPTYAGECRLAAAPMLLHQRKAGIHRARQARRAGDAVEGIIILLFSEVVDQQNCKAELVRKLFEDREVGIVVGIGVVGRGATDHLQRVNDNQNGVGMLGDEALDAFF